MAVGRGDADWMVFMVSVQERRKRPMSDERGASARATAGRCAQRDGGMERRERTLLFIHFWYSILICSGDLPSSGSSLSSDAASSSATRTGALAALVEIAERSLRDAALFHCS